jgi:hypothetical protein
MFCIGALTPASICPVIDLQVLCIHGRLVAACLPTLTLNPSILPPHNGVEMYTQKDKPMENFIQRHKMLRLSQAPLCLSYQTPSKIYTKTLL